MHIAWSCDTKKFSNQRLKLFAMKVNTMNVLIMFVKLLFFYYSLKWNSNNVQNIILNHFFHLLQCFICQIHLSPLIIFDRQRAITNQQLQISNLNLIQIIIGFEMKSPNLRSPIIFNYQMPCSQMNVCLTNCSSLF